jgi:hypothetical protein
MIPLVLGWPICLSAPDRTANTGSFPICLSAPANGEYGIIGLWLKVVSYLFGKRDGGRETKTPQKGKRGISVFSLQSHILQNTTEGETYEKNNKNDTGYKNDC